MRLRTPVIKYIKRLGQSVFTTRQIADVSGKSASSVTQGLNHLVSQGAVRRLYRGIWAETGRRDITPYSLIPFLIGRGRAYVSFLSALHLHGIIEQIPQAITLASTVHTKKIKTADAVYIIHRIAPEFFFGFDWHKGTGDYLIAEPEKALADCVYLSVRRKNQYAHFPELHFGASFSVKKTVSYLEKIPDGKARTAALSRLREILK